MKIVFNRGPEFDDIFEILTSTFNTVCPLAENTPENNVNIPTFDRIYIKNFINFCYHTLEKARGLLQKVWRNKTKRYRILSRQKSYGEICMCS